MGGEYTFFPRFFLLSGFRHAARPRHRSRASEQRRASVTMRSPACTTPGTRSESLADILSFVVCFTKSPPASLRSRTPHTRRATISMFGGAHICASTPDSDVCITPGPEASVTICGEQEGLALTLSCGQTVSRKRSAFPHAKLRVNEEAARETVRCVCCPSCNRPSQMRGKSMSAVCAALDLGIEDRAVAHPSSMRVMMALSR